MKKNFIRNDFPSKTSLSKTKNACLWNILFIKTENNTIKFNYNLSFYMNQII